MGQDAAECAWIELGKWDKDGWAKNGGTGGLGWGEGMRAFLERNRARARSTINGFFRGE